MSRLENRLRRALDHDPPRGHASLFGRGPADEALDLVRGREVEAIEALRALLARPDSSSRLKQNAIHLLAILLEMRASAPSLDDLYDALSAGHSEASPMAELEAEMLSHLDDDDWDTRVAAAIELLEISSDDRLAALRPKLLPLLPRLRERRYESPAMGRALLRLQGAPAGLQSLQEVAASSGPLPPNLSDLLDSLDRDLPADALFLLPGLFVRLQPIAERRAPRRIELGSVPAWDPQTVEAARVFQLFLRGAGRAGIAAAVDLLKAATPEMMVALLELSAAEGVQSVRLATALAADVEVAPRVREAAAEILRAADDPED